MVKAKFCFLQMERKGIPVDAVELGEPVFGISPEALDAIDVVRSQGELVVAMIDSMMACVAEIDQAVVAHPAVGVDHGFQIGMAANHRSQRGFCNIRDDLGIDLAITFEQTEDDGLGSGASPALAANTPRPEVRFIRFEIALQGRNPRAFFGQALTQTEEDRVDAANRKAGHLRCLRGR